jgi:3,4-dihydroxy 2-butanone 4-phosphate synthase/GTP cyclohydrolase II
MWFDPGPAGASALVEVALAEVAAGRPVVLADDPDDAGRTSAALVFAAEPATPAAVAFAVRHGSGFVCVALDETDCDRLRLRPVHHDPAYRTTVDGVGTGTGISARARAATIAALGSATSTAADFVRPGHVVPVSARAGGVLARRGRPEAAADLARLAGLRPAAALCDLVSAERTGEMADAAEAGRFAARHGLAALSVADLVCHRLRTEPRVRRCASTSLPTRYGLFTAVGYRDVESGAGGGRAAEHLALVAGPGPGTGQERGGDGVRAPVPVHVHPECLTGDIMGSQACGCGAALDSALAEIGAVGRGVVIYARPRRVTACGLARPAWTDRTGVAGVAAWILDDLDVSWLRLVGRPAGAPELVSLTRPQPGAGARLAG